MNYALVILCGGDDGQWSAHISCTEDEEERRSNNRRVNNHIADYFEKFYENKITLPYIETVGVGVKSKTAKCRNLFVLFQTLRNC